MQHQISTAGFATLGFFYTVITLLAITARPAEADLIVLPNVFVNGTAADADEVNENFSLLLDESNDQHNRITGAEVGLQNLALGKQNLITQGCSDDSAISRINEDGTVTCVIGPTGPPGPTGATGPQGAQGIQGPAGPGFSGFQYYTVGPGDFVPADSNNRISQFLSNLHGVVPLYTSSRPVYAGVHLPQGAIINQITAHVHDLEDTINIRFRLLRKNPTGLSGFVAGTEVTVVGNSGFVSDSAASAHIVNNSGTHYFLEVAPIGGSWTGNSNLAFQYAELRYTLE